MSNLAQIYQSDYDLIKAEQLMVKSFKLYSETRGLGHNSTLTVRSNLVMFCSLQNRHAPCQVSSGSQCRSIES